MKNQLINNLFLAMQNSMMASLGMNEFMTHPGDKGDSTELDWRKWFSIYLPKRYSVTKGKVVDYLGNESEQIDVIVYDNQYSPLVFDYNGVTYVTAESVYAVFEIKQTLTKDHIEYACKKAESVRKLARTSAPVIYSTGPKPPKPLHKIIAGLLTTKCSWESIRRNIENNLADLDECNRLDIVCSLNSTSGRILYDSNKKASMVECKDENYLMNLYLTLLTQLQVIGTVPAIEYDKYFDEAPSIVQIYNEQQQEKDGKEQTS